MGNTGRQRGRALQAGKEGGHSGRATRAGSAGVQRGKAPRAATAGGHRGRAPQTGIADGHLPLSERLTEYVKKAGLRMAEELPAAEEESATDVNLNYMSLQLRL